MRRERKQNHAEEAGGDHAEVEQLALAQAKGNGGGAGDSGLQRGEIEKRGEEEHHPGAVAEQVSEVQSERDFLGGAGLHALPGGEEGEDEEDDAQRGKQAHGELVATGRGASFEGWGTSGAEGGDRTKRRFKGLRGTLAPASDCALQVELN